MVLLGEIEDLVLLHAGNLRLDTFKLPLKPADLAAHGEIRISLLVRQWRAQSLGFQCRIRADERLSATAACEYTPESHSLLWAVTLTEPEGPGLSGTRHNVNFLLTYVSLPQPPCSIQTRSFPLSEETLYSCERTGARTSQGFMNWPDQQTKL
jgi:hypothetical protein